MKEPSERTTARLEWRDILGLMLMGMGILGLVLSFFGFIG